MVGMHRYAARLGVLCGGRDRGLLIRIGGGHRIGGGIERGIAIAIAIGTGTGTRTGNRRRGRGVVRR